MHSITIHFDFPVSAALPFWFLAISLFVPRIAMVVMYLQHQYSYITLPGIVLAALIPRLLILIWIFTAQGISGWFLLHLLVALLAFGGTSDRIRRRRASDL